MAKRDGPDWNQIVESHAGRVYRVAMRILGSVADAEDVSQEVFIEAFQLHKAGHVRSWPGLLVRLATLRSIDQFRRKRPAMELRDNDRVTTIEPPDEMAGEELAQWLPRAISLLPEQQATVFVMIHFEQLAREEIATTLAMSPDAVSAALYRARQNLAAQLVTFHQGASR